MNDNNNFKADKCILQYEQHQLLKSTDPSINAVVKTSLSESSLIVCEAEICDAVRPRRSSKGSRRTMPTTLLNANPSNFRDLVQKFTGRSAGVNLSSRRKWPVTLDFRSPASVPKEVIFPRIENYHCAINRHVDYGESHVTCEWEGTKAASYGSGQLNNDYELYGGCGDHAHGHHENHGDDDLFREYLEDSCFHGVDYMGCDDDFYHDAVFLEEFMMRDLDL